MIGRLWAERSLSERTALLFVVLGATWRLLVEIIGEGAVDTGPEFLAFLAGLAFLAVFVLLAVPVSIMILFRGGAQFTAPWRRTLDRLLPSIVLVVMALAFFAR